MAPKPCAAIPAGVMLERPRWTRLYRAPEQFGCILFIWIALCGLSCPSARSEINGADTLEWLACDSDVVAVGQIAGSTTTKGPGDVIYERCLLRVTESIKGSPSSPLAFTYRHFPRDDTSWIRPRVELLAFLRRSPDADDENLRGQLVPICDRHPLSVIDLRLPPRDLFDRDGRRLTARGEILAVARVWAKSLIHNSLDRDAASDSDAFRQLYLDSSVLLTVPAEEKYRDYFMRQAHSAKLWERRKAAEELWKFPGPETEKLLRSLLDDTTEPELWNTGGSFETVSFPVRIVASESLKKLGLAPPDLPLKRATTPEERQHARQTYWTRRFQGDLPPGWNLLSVTDGPTMRVKSPYETETREATVAVIEIGNGQAHYTLMLVPFDWPPENFPPGHRLGADSPGSTGARIFFCEDATPRDVQVRLIEKYHLVEPPWLREKWEKRISETRSSK